MTIATPPSPSVDEVTVDDAARLPGRGKPYLVIRPTRGFWVAFNLRDLWQFRDLLFTLAGRDVKVRYKQTALGVAWVILQPLLAAGIFSFVFGKVAKLPTDGVPSFIFAFVGLIGWGAFNNTLNKISTCLLGNVQLVSKIYFPRLALPLATLGSVLLDFAVAVGLLAVIMLLNGLMPGWPLFLLPVWLALLIALAMGLGLWAAAWAVRYRDVTYLVPVLLQMGMYASPVAYSVLAVSEKHRAIYYLNPLAALTEGFRWSVLHVTHVPPWWALSYSAVVAVCMLIVGVAAFKKMEREFADVI